MKIKISCSVCKGHHRHTVRMWDNVTVGREAGVAAGDSCGGTVRVTFDVRGTDIRTLQTSAVKKSK